MDMRIVMVGVTAAILNRFIILHNANRDTNQKDKTKLRILRSHINHHDKERAKRRKSERWSVAVEEEEEEEERAASNERVTVAPA